MLCNFTQTRADVNEADPPSASRLVNVGTDPSPRAELRSVRSLNEVEHTCGLRPRTLLNIADILDETEADGAYLV